MKERIGEQIYEFLTLDCYLELLSFSLIVVGVVLSVCYFISGISIMDVSVLVSPLFFVIFGVVVFCFRFIRLSDKDLECD